MQDDALRALLTKTTSGLEPRPDTALTALGNGRRMRRHARVRNAVFAVVAAAAVLVPLAWASVSGTAAPAPLHPAAWPTGTELAPPTTRYPSTHIGGRNDTAKLSRDQWEVRRAFEQKAADVLRQLLPLNGRIMIADDTFASFRIENDSGRYAIRLAALPLNGAVIPNLVSCPAYLAGRPAQFCVQGDLPGGAKALAMSGVEANSSPDWLGPQATMLYQDMYVTVYFPPTEGTAAPVPVTPNVLLTAVTDPRFVQLLDFLAANPGLDGYTHDVGRVDRP
ncbi:hypothetical protein [Streptomyces sp. SID3343]|uniref:hypothetical protein n=1 Tax=Streptomyces sp. SID3343 TaxID=2690260 RepID=UPI00136B5686|nr:hypothetical protein [Streptomyces sp. SID3343]MYW00437.1 hypothetical protein [Streptomyces sp. SID3343]